MTLTARGWVLLVTTAAALAAAALFGIQELYAMAAASAALLVFAAIWVQLHRFDVTTRRALGSSQVAAGESAKVELTVANLARRRSPLLAVLDPFDHGGWCAAFRLAPLRPGEQVTTPYRLPPTSRGRYLVGPLLLSLSDPFELVRRTRIAAPTSPLTVHPTIATLRAPRGSSGVDRFGLAGRGAFGPGGEEFSSLRPYREGDDLRRVHWPSTARLDQVMVRQADAVAHPRCTVAVDLRADLWSPALLEEALAGAASVLDAARRTGIEIRLVTTTPNHWTSPVGPKPVATSPVGSGHPDRPRRPDRPRAPERPGHPDRGGHLDTGFGSTSAHWARVLDALALAEAAPTGRAAVALGTLLRDRGHSSRTSEDDTLTVITSSRATQTDLRSLRPLAPPSALILVVLGPDASVGDPAKQGLAPQNPGLGRYLQVAESGTFAQAWGQLGAPRGRLARR